MPTIEQLGAKIGDQVTFPVRSIDGTKFVGMHTATVVGISPTETFVDPPAGECNLAVLNQATGEIRNLYQLGPNAGHRDEEGRWITTGYGPCRVPPDPTKGEDFVQSIHSGYCLFSFAGQEENTYLPPQTIARILRGVISKAASFLHR